MDPPIQVAPGRRFLLRTGLGLLAMSIIAVAAVMYQLAQVRDLDLSILRRIAEEEACDRLLSALEACEATLDPMVRSPAGTAPNPGPAERWNTALHWQEVVSAQAEDQESRELVRQLQAGMSRITWFRDGSGDRAAQVVEIEGLQKLADQLRCLGAERVEALSGGLMRKNRQILELVAILGILGITVIGLVLLVAYRRQVRLLERLTERECRLAAVIEHCRDAIITLDDGHRIIAFNQAAERIFGWSAAEMLGGPLDRLIPAGLRSAHAGHMRAYFTSPEAPTAMAPGRRILAVHRDGHQFPVTASLSRVEVAGRTLATAILRDHTEEERVLEDLRRSRDAALAAKVAKDELLAVVSHEIRTPLTGVLGMLRLARRTPELPAALGERLQIAQRSAESMHLILNDTLDLARLEATRLELHQVPTALAEELRQCHGLFAAQAEERGLAMPLALAPDLPPGVLADPLRLRQVVSNLLGNAIKFTREGSVTLAALARPDGEDRLLLTITVRDTGIGMSAAARERIFEPFTQAEAGTAHRYGGTGLGLSIVKRLVELMGGRIVLESAPGQGSTFTVTLPLVACAAPTGRGSDVFRIVDQPRGPVLVVDDEAVNRLVVRGLLAGHRLTVAEASTGAQCLAQRLALGRGLSAILLDLGLPDLPGTEVLERLRAAEREAGLPPVPVIVLSGTSHPEGAAHWRRLGFANALVKPVGEAELLAALDLRPKSGLTPPRTPPLVVPPPPSTLSEILVLDVPHVALLRRRGLLEPLIGVFAEGLPERMRLLAEHPGDADQLHALAGAAATVGLQRLRQEALDLEIRVRRGEPLIDGDLRVLERLAHQGLAELGRPPSR